jgi:hypothetical protein
MEKQGMLSLSIGLILLFFIPSRGMPMGPIKSKIPWQALPFQLSAIDAHLATPIPAPI